MNWVRNLSLLLVLCLAALAGIAQTSPVSSTAVPRLMNFSGKATDAQGREISGVVGVTFAVYGEQTGDDALWIETQTVNADAKGAFIAQLGATKPEGLPLELFTSGGSRWLGVSINGGEEQPRVLLVAVPYALKAADAETVGGLPASAFVLAAPVSSVSGSGSSGAAAATSSSESPVVSPAAAVTGSGTANYVPLWTGASTVGNSVLFQTGSGTTGRIGVNTGAPTVTLDVKGAATIRGILTLPAPSAATAAAGKNSQPLSLTASAFNSGTAAAVAQTFRWLAEPAGNNTASPAGTLNLLFGSGTTSPTETGLKIANNGDISFAAGQTFPGAGTISSVTAGTDLTGGGASGSVTLNLDTTRVPQLKAANTFTGNQTVNGNLTSTGVVTGSSFQIGSSLFAFGDYASGNAFLGFAGNPTNTGADNTGSGLQALSSITTGGDNTASGAYALQGDSTGGSNTAVGANTLSFNSSGANNTAMGEGALFHNTIAGSNTAVGYQALTSNTTSYNNTAMGADALESNNTGYGNTAVGQGTLSSNADGSNNVAIGLGALSSNTSGIANTASGSGALLYNTVAVGNTAMGSGALQANTTGEYNTAVGFFAFGTNTTGGDLTCIGYDCDTTIDGLRNATAVGAHARVGASNSLVLGGTGKYAVKVGIGTETPTSVFTIAQGAGHPVSDSWETYSSRRWKTNIHTLPNALAKIEHLRGVSYDMKDSGKHEIGVIAEEVGAVVPELVSYEPNGKDARSVDYARLTALLIEATKQQQREIENLKSELRETRQTLKQVKAQVAKSQTTLLATK